MTNFAGIDIQADNIIVFLKQELTFHTVCRQLTNKMIIHANAQERGITVTDDEVQAEADRLRRELKLESTQKTLEWLKEKMITTDDWEQSIYDHLLREKMATAMFSQDAAKQFHQSKLDYEKVVLYKIVIDNPQLAQELAYQIEEEEISFFEAAHLHNVEAHHRRNCGYEGEISRWALAPDTAASIFSAPAKTVVGPLSIETLCALFYVDEFVEPELTEAVHKEICDRLFLAWLDSELQRLVA